MRITIEFDDNDNNILREAFEKKLIKTIDSSFTKKSDCSFNLNLIQPNLPSIGLESLTFNSLQPNTLTLQL